MTYREVIDELVDIISPYVDSSPGIILTSMDERMVKNMVYKFEMSYKESDPFYTDRTLLYIQKRYNNYITSNKWGKEYLMKFKPNYGK